jgi:hypothetical protein
MLGQQMAEQTIIAQADAGMSPDRIAEVQEEIAARNLSEATTKEARTFAREYDRHARALAGDLQEEAERERRARHEALWEIGE